MSETQAYLNDHQLCKIKDATRPRHTARYRLHWSFFNSKLARDHTVSFGLPAFRASTGITVCPNASTCALVCYARQGHYVQPNVIIPREHNLACVVSWPVHQLIDALTSDLDNLHRSWHRVRIHDSGDFLTPAYFHVWLAVARHCKDKEFYGYTKMISLLREHRHLLPSNLHLIQSVGGKEDAILDTRYAHAVIFPTSAARKAAGYVDATHSDRPAWSHKRKIGLVYHGTTYLTESTQRVLTERYQTVIGA